MTFSMSRGGPHCGARNEKRLDDDLSNRFFMLSNFAIEHATAAVGGIGACDPAALGRLLLGVLLVAVFAVKGVERLGILAGFFVLFEFEPLGRVRKGLFLLAAQFGGDLHDGL